VCEGSRAGEKSRRTVLRCLFDADWFGNRHRVLIYLRVEEPQSAY
jgi:hypothetical protein